MTSSRLWCSTLIPAGQQIHPVAPFFGLKCIYWKHIILTLLSPKSFRRSRINCYPSGQNPALAYSLLPKVWIKIKLSVDNLHLVGSIELHLSANSPMICRGKREFFCSMWKAVKENRQWVHWKSNSDYPVLMQLLK